MKAVIINGTMRKSSTYNLAHMVLNKIEKLEIREFFLPKDQPYFCTSCYNCILKDYHLCPHYKEVSIIRDAMMEADLIVFTSPVYVLEISGQLKSLFDHFAYMWMSHRPEEAMFNKIGLGVLTTAGFGINQANKTIQTNMQWWGIKRYYKLGMAVAAASFKDVSEKNLKKMNVKAEKIAKKISRVLNKKDNLNGKLKTRFLFSMMKAMQKGHPEWSPVDSSYWKQVGFLDGKKPWKVVKH